MFKNKSDAFTHTVLTMETKKNELPNLYVEHLTVSDVDKFYEFLNALNFCAVIRNECYDNLIIIYFEKY